MARCGGTALRFLWYLSDPGWPAPNLAMLRSALAQSGWEGSELDESSWRDVVEQRVADLDWAKVLGDVRPFVESPADLETLTRENLSRVLSRRRSPGSR